MHPATGSGWLVVLVGKIPTQTCTCTWTWTLHMQTFHGLAMVMVEMRVTILKYL